MLMGCSGGMLLWRMLREGMLTGRDVVRYQEREAGGYMLYGGGVIKRGESEERKGRDKCL